MGKAWSKGMQLVDRKVCGICGKPFYASPAQIKRSKTGVVYCSKKCRGLATRGKNNPGFKERIPCICKQCGKSFSVHPSTVNKGRGIYCSKQCAEAGLITTKHECPTCRKSIQGQNLYCSNECRDAARPKAKKDLVECSYCHTTFEARPIEVKNGNAKFCSRDCWRKYKSSHAENNYTHAHGGKRADLDNRYFRSSWEANWARYLNWLVETKTIQKWEYEVDTFEFINIKRGTRFYTPDFKVFNNDGSIEYHEIKGYMDSKSATKLKRMAKNYPNIKIILIEKSEYQAVARQLKTFLPNWE